MTEPGTQRGVTLIELLITMSIGIIIIGTIAQALALTSASYLKAESLVAMQEQADVAIGFLTEDIRHAGHWGLSGSARKIGGRSSVGDENPLSLQLPQRCSASFVLDLAHGVEPRPDTDSWQCNLSSATGSDAIAIRHASPDHVVSQPNRLQVLSGPQPVITDDGRDPTAANTPSERMNLNVRGYYIAAQSSLFPDQPVLRRLTLTALSTRPHFIDEEIAAGIERMRLAVDVDTNDDGFADETMAANDARIAQRDSDNVPVNTVLGVHVWLVVRSAESLWPQTNAQQLNVGSQQWTAPNDGRLRFVSQQYIAIAQQVHTR